MCGTPLVNNCPYFAFFVLRVIVAIRTHRKGKTLCSSFLYGANSVLIAMPPPANSSVNGIITIG